MPAQQIPHARRRGPAKTTPETKHYTLLLEPEIAEAAKRDGSLSGLVRALLRAHQELKTADGAQLSAAGAQRNRPTGRGFLAGGPSLADELAARKEYEKELEG